MQGLGVLVDHLDGAPVVQLAEEDRELAEAAYQDLQTHLSRLGQVLATLRVPGPEPETSSGLRRLRSKASRSILERLSPTQESAPLRFLDVLGRIPRTLMSLPGRLLLRQHGLVGDAPAARSALPELAWAPPLAPAACAARLARAGFPPNLGLPGADALEELLALRLLLGRMARKHPGPLPAWLADAEALGRAAWWLVEERRALTSLLGRPPEITRWQQAWKRGADPLAKHPHAAALWAMAPEAGQVALAQACADAGLETLAQDPRLPQRLWLLAGPAAGRLHALLSDPALGPSAIPWRLHGAPEHIGDKALPPMEHRLVQQLFGVCLSGVPRVALSAGHPIWRLETADPWLAPGHWARTG